MRLDAYGNVIEVDRHAGSVYDTGPQTPGYHHVCGYNTHSGRCSHIGYPLVRSAQPLTQEDVHRVIASKAKHA